MQVDPVLGGTLNPYVYAHDPINLHDYSGEFIPAFVLAIVAAASVASASKHLQSNPKSPSAWVGMGLAVVGGNSALRVVARARANPVMAVMPRAPRSSVAPKAVSPSFKSSLSVGQAAHKQFSRLIVDNGGTANKAVFHGSKLRPDGYYHATNTVIELKPGNPAGVLQGTSQLQRYQDLSGGQGQLWLYNQTQDGSFNYWRHLQQ